MDWTKRELGVMRIMKQLHENAKMGLEYPVPGPDYARRLAEEAASLTHLELSGDEPEEIADEVMNRLTFYLKKKAEAN